MSYWQPTDMIQTHTGHVTYEENVAIEEDVMCGAHEQAVARFVLSTVFGVLWNPTMVPQFDPLPCLVSQSEIQMLGHTYFARFSNRDYMTILKDHQENPRNVI